MALFGSGYHIRFKCADGIQFEFDFLTPAEIGQVRSWCGLFRDLALPDIFKPCSFDVRFQLVTLHELHEPDFNISALQALCRSLRYPYLFNSKFYRYALKNKDKQSSKA